MLKIVLDARRVRDFGIGTYIRNLVQALAGIDTANGYTLVGFAQDRPLLARLPENFQFVPVQRSDLDPWDNLSFPLFLHRFKHDLCHIPLNRVPLAMPKPFVVTVHDVSSLLFEAGSGVRMKARKYRLMRGLRRADRIIAVSEATRRDVQKVLGIPADRLRVVYNAPDPEFFTHRHGADARVAGPDSHQRELQRILERYSIHYPFLLYAGNIRKQKNIPRLVEAFAVAREGLASDPVYHDLHLIIIGDEISRNPAVRRAVIQSRVEQSVRFLGFVPFDTLRHFFEAAAAFVFPSLYEGFGLPPLEAMASGTPVITSAVSSLPEVVGDAAVLVNPENVFEIARGIHEVLTDTDLRQSLVRRGLQQAAKFSWERAARQVLEIYGEVAV